MKFKNGLLWFVVFSVMVFSWWVVISMGLSIVKTTTNSCEERWSVDSYVGTDWLCETTNE